MQLPLIYLDASAIEEVPLPLWREAFEMLGWPASLGDKQATFTHDDAGMPSLTTTLRTTCCRRLRYYIRLAPKRVVKRSRPSCRKGGHNYLNCRMEPATRTRHAAVYWNSAVVLRWLTYW